MHKLARRTPIAKAATWVLLGAALAVPSFGLLVPRVAALGGLRT